MKMNWFVIHNTEHLGPFSEDVLEQLYNDGDIQKETLVWKEGMDKAKTYEFIFINKEVEDVFKPIIETVELKTEVHVVGDSPPDFPPPLPPKSIKEDLPVFEKVENEFDSELEEYTEEVIEEAKNLGFKKSKSLKIILFILILIFAIFIGYKILKVEITRPNKMTLIDFTRLELTSAKSSDENQFAFSIAPDKSVLWMATNLPFSGEVSIILKSLKNKTLGEDYIEARSTGFLKNKIVSFENFTFVQGSNFVDGYYQVEVVTDQDLEVPVAYRLFDNRKKQFQFSKEILISNLNENQFANALMKEHSKRNSNEKAFWDELVQKYITISSITAQIQESLDKVFLKDSKKWLVKVKEFEADYKRNFGNFFTNFVIANDSSYEELKSQEFSNKLEIISNYTRLSRLAKNIGNHAMVILNELEVFDENTSDENYEKFRSESLGKLQAIIDICEQKKQVIENR